MNPLVLRILVPIAVSIAMDLYKEGKNKYKYRTKPTQPTDGDIKQSKWWTRND